MEITNPFLTASESLALRLLAEDRSYEAVKRECHLTSLELCSFLVGIRKKTGIENTKNSAECRAYLENFAKAQAAGGPNAKEMELLQRLHGVGYLQSQTLEAAAHMMRITPEEAARLYQSALRAAGIFAKNEREARVQTKIFLASRNLMKTAMPLSENHELVLHCYAQHMKPRHIAATLGAEKFPEPYVHKLIAEGLNRLGICSRGRGVQQRLVAVALKRKAQAEAMPPVTMDDPAF